MPNANLQDFWKTLWHVDVYKDHKGSYDKDTVNGFLPNAGTYITTQETLNGKNISDTGSLASRSGGSAGNIIEFTDLFEYLTSTKLDDLQKGRVNEITLNTKLIGTEASPVKYEIQIFNTNGVGIAKDASISPSIAPYITTDDARNAYKVDQFIGNSDVALFVDTSVHLPELLNQYDDNKKLVYAYTREIESDPAGKSTYLTIKPPDKNQKRFYYELPAPINPTMVVYPPYTDEAADDGMSYFYCKFPVTLSNNGIRENKKFNLKTNLSYVNEKGQLVTVTDGANTAGAINKFKDGLKKIAGYRNDNNMQQMVFISKHHGDVAQSLVKFRAVEMECPVPPTKTINTADYNAAFVSYDINAIIKALTIETPFIFMYPSKGSDSDKRDAKKENIIVWKNNNLNSPAVIFESEKKYTEELQKKLLVSLNDYIDKQIHITINKAMVDAKVEIDLALKHSDILPGKSLEEYATLYRNILKTGVHIATLLNYIPNAPLKEISEDDKKTFDKQAEIASIILVVGEENPSILSKITRLKGIQKQLIEKEQELVIPIQYRTILLKGFDLKAEPVSFEKEVIIKFKEYEVSAKEAVKEPAKLRAGPTYSFAKGDRRVDHMWEVTNLTYNIGDFSIDSLSCRFGTKLNISWAFDVIHYIYNNLNDDYKSKFITTLKNIVEKAPTIPGKPQKMDTFLFGLSLIGVPIPIGLAGGSYTEIVTALPKTEETTILRLRKGPDVEKGPVIEEESLEITALKQTYNDIAAHLEFIVDIINLYNYSGRIPENAFEMFGLQIYDKFFKGVFGPGYRVDPKILAGLAAQRRYKKPMSGGGDYIAFKADIIKEVFEKEGLKEEPAGGAGVAPVILNAPNLFNKDKPFLTSQFSIINLYEEIVGRETEELLELRIQRIKSLRPLKKRIKIYSELQEKRKYIKSLITQIKNEEGKVWEPLYKNEENENEENEEEENEEEENEEENANEENENEVMPLVAPVSAPPSGPPASRKRKREETSSKLQTILKTVDKNEAKRARTHKNQQGGTRRKLKESKLRTIKKKRINRRRRTQRR